MRSFVLFGLAAAALLAVPAAATEPTGQIEVKSFDDLSIKPSDMPAGCKLLLRYGDERSAEVTCGTQEAFERGFAVSTKFQVDCTQKADAYACVIKKA